MRVSFKWSSGIALAVTTLFASPLLAGSVPAQGDQNPILGDNQAQQQAPNVLVVRTPKQNITPQKQGDFPSAAQQMDDAQLFPVRVDLQRDGEGQVNVDQMVRDARKAMTQTQGISLKASQQIQDDQQLPSNVRDTFQQASLQGGENEFFFWRFFLPRITFNRTNFGVFGYGHTPRWGYNNRYSYTPTWGTYYQNNLYPYSYARYQTDGGYDYTYYYNNYAN